MESGESYEVDIEVEEDLNGDLDGYQITWKSGTILHPEEPEVWNAKGMFIDMVATKVYYVLPAFAGGLAIGVMFWLLYILLFKTSTRLQKKIVRSSRDNLAASETTSTSVGTETELSSANSSVRGMNSKKLPV